MEGFGAWLGLREPSLQLGGPLPASSAEYGCYSARIQNAKLPALDALRMQMKGPFQAQGWSRKAASGALSLLNKYSY